MCLYLTLVPLQIKIHLGSLMMIYRMIHKDLRWETTKFYLWAQTMKLHLVFVFIILKLYIQVLKGTPIFLLKNSEAFINFLFIILIYIYNK